MLLYFINIMSNSTNNYLQKNGRRMKEAGKDLANEPGRRTSRHRNPGRTAAKETPAEETAAPAAEAPAAEAAAEETAAPTATKQPLLQQPPKLLTKEATNPPKWIPTLTGMLTKTEN
jgi:hypothetical protein